MTSQSDSPDMIFQCYTPRKRKFLDPVQHSESNSAVSHGSGLVTNAKYSHRGEESFIKSPAGFLSALNNSQGVAPQDIPSETTELSGIRCTTSPCRPNEAILHAISTDNDTEKCQDPIQSFSLVMECTNHTTSSKPMHPHITFQLMHTKIESGNSYAKHAYSTDQRQKAVAQKLLLSCEKGDQSIVAMDHPSLSPHDIIQQKERIPRYEAVKHNPTKAVDISGTLSPHSLDDEINSVVDQLSPSVYESLWDGTIQLSSTVKVSVIAFFKRSLLVFLAGEKKNHDITWPKAIEIKGKVKLDAFEKFVQELHRSQTRSLMVISLCWKVGTSKAGLQGMKEVAENFAVSQKVGFADICDGSSLYVCPRSDAVITILAKCGFFKGMSAVDTNQDALIGCIVWRRNPMSKIMDHKRSETNGKGSPCVPHVGARPSVSLPFLEGYEATPCSNNPGMDSSRNASKIQNDIDQTQEIRSTYVKTHAVATGLPSQCGHAENTGERVHPTETVMPNSPFKLSSMLTPQLPFKASSLIACQLSQVPFETALHEVPEVQQNVQPITDSHSGSFGAGHPISHSQAIKNYNPVFQPNKTGVKGLPLKSLDVQQRTIHHDLAAQKNHMVEAFSGSIARQEYASNAAESSKQHEINPFLLQPNTYGSDTTDGTDDLPEFDFTNLHRVEVKYDVHPLNRETAITSDVLIRPKLSDNMSSRPFQQSSQPSFQVEGIKNHDNAEVKGNVTDIMSRETVNQVSHGKTERENFKNKHGNASEDMADLNFQGLDNEKPHQSSSTKQPSPSLKSSTGSNVPSQVFPPITERSNEIEGISSDHHPNMPPGCLNIPRDQNSFPQLHPPVLEDQRLAAQHPPVLPYQAPVPWLPPPVLEDPGFAPRRTPPALPGQGFIPWHPPVPADQGFVPQHPPPLADQGSFPRRRPPALAGQYFPRRPSFHANQGSFPRHPPPHPRPPFAPGHMRPPSNSAPPGPWRPVLHPGQERHHYGPPGRSNGPSGSGNIPGHRHPSFGNGPGCRKIVDFLSDSIVATSVSEESGAPAVVQRSHRWRSGRAHENLLGPVVRPFDADAPTDASSPSRPRFAGERARARTHPNAAAAALSCCPCTTTTSSPLSIPRSACRCRYTGGVAFSSSSSSCGGASAAAWRVHGGGARRRSGQSLVVAASSSSGSKDETAEGEKPQEEDPEFNPFGFVTDNPSSRGAIQLPESPAEDGNVGLMLYRIEDKGREFGSRVKSGKLRWFVRETSSTGAQRGTVVFIHGAPTQSFSYRMVMSQMADAGYHCFAPDWIGFGFSDMPQPGYGFDYTEEEFHKSFDELLGTLNITEPFFLVVQGFLVGSYGLTWALKNSSKVLKVSILNSPLTVSSPVPGLFNQLRLPLFGEFTCQNAVLAVRFIEAGSPYVLKLEKADAYRLPYLSSGAPGFALLEAARKANFRDVLSRISAGFSSNSWEKPILLVWGISDKYLPLAVTEEFQKGNPSGIKLEPIEGAGHMPQEDWPEKVVTALRSFL